MSCVQVTAYIAHRGITHIGNGCVLETNVKGDVERVISRVQREIQRRIEEIAANANKPACMLWVEWNTVEPDGKTPGTTLSWLLKSPQRRFLRWDMTIDGHLPQTQKEVCHG